MAFTGNENHYISLDDAAALTKRYRDNSPSGSILGHFYGKEAIQSILDQPNCVGIRIYYGESSDGAKQLVISGVKGNEDDIYTGELAELGTKSPPYSGANNPLNS